ncbi:MAG: ATP-binding protein [Chlamydiota bacterium]|nr:ATP-binding protein [Chlamydiota bacterium]
MTRVELEKSTTLREKFVSDIWTRWIIIGFIVPFIVLLAYFDHTDNAFPLLFIFSFMSIYNLLFMFIYRKLVIANFTVNTGIILDVSSVTAALYFFHGVNSPLFLLYLFLIYLEAFYLRIDTCIITFVSSLTAFSVLAYLSVPHINIVDHWVLYSEKMFILILTGMISIFYAKKIQSRSKRLRGVINNVSDIIMVGDRHGNCSFINPHGTTIFGYTSEEIRNKPVKSLFLEPGRFSEFYHDVYMREQRNTSLSIISKTGEKIPVLWRGIAFMTDQKKPREILLIGRDMRESTRYIEEIEKKTDEVSRLYEIIAYEMSAITSTDIRIQDMMHETIDIIFKALHADACSIMIIDEKNKELYTVAGKDASLHQSNHHIKLPIGQGIAGWVALKGERLNIPDVEEESRYFRNPNLHQDIRSLLCEPLKFGTKILGVINVSRKTVMPFSEAESEILSIIASRAALAIENKSIVAQLEDEKVMLNRILNTAGEAILCLDSDKKVEFINEKGISLLEWSSDEIVGKKFCKDIASVRNQRGKLICSNDCVLEKACVSDDKTAKVEAMIQTKSGKQIWTELHYSAITDSESNLSYGVLSIRDISQRKIAERLRVQLTSNIVHELRTPLTYMRGYVDLLLMGRMGPLNGEQTNSIGIVRDSIFRLMSLIDNLLEVARMEEGRFYLNFSPVSLQSLLFKIVNLARAEGSRKNIEIALANAEKIPMIYADEKRLSEVFINLLSNALKFTSSGGKIEVLCSDEEETVLIRVKDTGVGISSDYQQKIFSRFSQIGQNDIGKPGEGAGLGLNIVKRITEAHGGEVWVESDEGKGSSFFIKLPKRTQSMKQTPSS